MELIRRNKNAFDPFELLRDFQTELDHFFTGPIQRTGTWEGALHPEIEVEENEKEYILTADLPGMRKDDFNISVEGSHVTLSGERKVEAQKKDKGYHYCERRYGSFSRSLTLPRDIKADEVKAAYKDGVLQVTLPKSEKDRVKKIDVEVK